jgi:hypothetical protein
MKQYGIGFLFTNAYFKGIRTDLNMAICSITIYNACGYISMSIASRLNF